MKIIKDVLGYWHYDWTNNRKLFWLGLAGVVCNISASVIMATTAPHSPLLELFGVWLVGSVFMAIASYQRKNSFLMLLMLTYMVLNFVGLVNSLR